MPFSVIVSEVTELPLRHSNIDQCEYGFGPGTGFYEPSKAPVAASLQRRTETLGFDEIQHQFGRNGSCTPNPFMHSAKLVITGRTVQHSIVSGAACHKCKMGKSP